MRTLIRCLALVTVTAVLASPVAAQSVFSGVVLDPNGEPVEGVTIYLTNIKTSTQLDFPTTAQGRFEFSGLAPGDYRVTSVPSVGMFSVTLVAGEPVFREIKLAFGPFEEIWDVTRANPSTVTVPRNLPAGWRCTNRVTGLPLCAPASIVEEFERDEVERLKSPVLVPRRIGLPPVYPQPLVDARIQGAVVLQGQLSADGTFTGVQVVTSDHAELTAAAMASVRSVTWEPARIRGVAKEVPLKLTIRYRLDGALPAPPRAPGAAQPTETPAFAPRGVAQSVAAQAPAAVQQPGAATPNPTFEVASVKPNNSGAPMVTVRTLPGGGFQAVNQTLRGLIRFAYGLQDFQLVGPDWIDTARFDITATAGRQPAPGEIQQMVRALLAERFKLVMRSETRDAPIYELAFAREDRRLGPQLRPADPMACRTVAPGQPPFPGPGQLQGCGSFFGGAGRITGRSITIDQLTNNLTNQAGRRVLNRSDLMGLFDVDMQFSGGAGGGLGPLPSQPGEPPPPPDDRPALTTAVQEQLGLRLNNARGPLEVSVIESVSQPTPD